MPADDFLRELGLGDSQIIPYVADASSRRYYKIANTDYLLMEAPPAEHDLHAFMDIAEHLRRLGLAAPKIYGCDKAEGFLLLQDFGDKKFSTLLQEGRLPAPLYTAAVQVLIHLQRHENNNKIPLPAYDNDTLYNEAALFPQWYMRYELSVTVGDDFSENYRSCIMEALENLPSLPPCLVLRDYHIDNLMQIDGTTIGEDSPLVACGLLDFQDALIGSPAYDLMSILEDARVAVDENLQERLYQKYLEATALPPGEFAHHYAVLGCIRHLKVLGIFTRLSVRDNKPDYRQHLPHVKSLAKKHLRNPLWAELQKLLTAAIPDF